MYQVSSCAIKLVILNPTIYTKQYGVLIYSQ
jgi:hypothetical protein